MNISLSHHYFGPQSQLIGYNQSQNQKGRREGKVNSNPEIVLMNVNTGVTSLMPDVGGNAVLLVSF